VALSAIARQSEDKIIRQAYQRRKDEIFFHNMALEEKKRKLEQAEAQIAEQPKIRAELQAQLANKE
jgi:CCR4-NOT transcriptional regulation complex NOT5 subunit